MFAVIRTGGKQYLVEPGKKIKIDPPSPRLRRAKKIEDTKDKEIIFSEVLLLGNSSTRSGQEKLEIGNPLVKGAKVTAKVLRQGKDKKVIIFKYNPKKRYRKKTGHRQNFTEVEITKIEV